MFEVSIDTLELLPDLIKNELGVNAFKAMLGDHLSKDIKDLKAHEEAHIRAHPFAQAWERMLADIQQSKVEKSLKLSEETIFLLDLFVSLQKYPRGHHFDRLLLKLQNREEYFSASFEALICRCYREFGFKVDPGQELEGVRTPDFYIRMGTATVAIECKSMQDLASLEDKLWVRLKYTISNSMRNIKRFWHIQVVAQKALTGNDLVPLLDMVKAFLKSNRPGRVTNGHFTVTGQEITQPEHVIQGDLRTPMQDTFHGLLEWEEMLNDHGQLISMNSTFIELVPFFNAEQTKRILSQINAGYGQIPAAGPGVLHIEIPYRNAQRIIDVADKAYQRVFGYLKQKPRINAVVLCARTINPSITNGGDPVLSYFAIIPNPNPRVDLPASFKLIGSKELNFPIESLEDGEPFSTDQGTMFLEFEINSPLQEQRGGSLINYCSPDGRYQLNLWQSFENFFRVDVVAPAFGRRTAQANLNDLSVGVVHKLAISWSSDGLLMAINGKSLQLI